MHVFQLIFVCRSAGVVIINEVQAIPNILVDLNATRVQDAHM